MPQLMQDPSGSIPVEGSHSAARAIPLREGYLPEGGD